MLFFIWYMVAVLPYYIVMDAWEKYTLYLDKRGKNKWDAIPVHLLIVFTVLFFMSYSAQFYGN